MIYTPTSWVCFMLCLSSYVLEIDALRISIGGSNLRQNTHLQLKPSLTDMRGPKMDQDAYTIAILGDLHLDPRHMDDHHIGREHFKTAMQDKAGKTNANTVVVSLGDLGESKSISPETTKELFAGTTGCHKLAREFLDGFDAPFEVIGGNHDLEGIDEFATDETNLDAFMSILGKETPQFKRLIAPKTMLVGLGSTVFREARYTSHEVFIDDAQVILISDLSFVCYVTSPFNHLITIRCDKFYEYISIPYLFLHSLK
jgi:hypothetical protein